MTHRYSGVIHAGARCEDCAWRTDFYKNALANGARHHYATGHTVNVEQAISVTYTNTLRPERARPAP